MGLVCSSVLVGKVYTSHMVIVVVDEGRNRQLFAYFIPEGLASNDCIRTSLIRPPAFSFDKRIDSMYGMHCRKRQDDIIVLPTQA